ncbi:helix-turn-helix domain-containing protein [Bacteroides thetaiotaomicron]|uniref:helix-turn-helix domain-containing protein n=1 Tax=Bacteroides thetaiotaomicron TaxID=818 RepID=UPI00232D55D2|nr:helix-turn-helix domain-containing protein [Bacteroides thetaiotaomicron]MDC2014629.1 MerR family transcriptional regulator [Bacteroides thetaiotaomicron]MDC2019103.1 MerR family transcriptional regulator [Bacteroides thetaiotaomicron]MDC2037005.1 MerR family transcriptional regulator [Bacteroides thetaiotaomicron]MDC2041280.1 MerR family transcriptional regulator [Bacteroides thetaiotaomicron]MDC2045763.1 MerR family transcriptional regulator [Bacteroides thetaiotaomicron]
MDAISLSPNAMLIQGMTESRLESMISRLLDEKLATIIESTPKVEESPKDGLYKRKDTAKRLQISLPTLDAWTKAGIINARRIGTRVYYTDKDINDALKKVSK